MTDWSFWWEFNKEPLLDLRRNLFRPEPTTGQEGFYLGDGYRRQGKRSLRASPATVRQKIVPALLSTLQGTSSNDIATGCLIALAKIGEDHRGHESAELERALRPFLADPSQQVAETAAAALGILANDSSAMLLSDLLGDTRAGRRAVARSEVPYRTRAFAAYGLSILGAQSPNEDVRRYVVHKLSRALEASQDPSSNLTTACVLGLGRVPLPFRGVLPEGRVEDALPATASREAQILYLLDALGSQELDRIAQAHLPTTLGTLLQAPGEAPFEVKETLRRRTAETLLAKLEPRSKAHRELRQSCVLALGAIGDNDADAIDERIRERLLDRSSLGSDRQSIHFALIAAGQVGARDGHGDPVGVAPIRSELMRTLARGRSDSLRWSALGLALLERGLRQGGHLYNASSAQGLRAALEESRSAPDISALAIACGILGDTGALETLVEKLDQTATESAQGKLCLALGILGEARSIDLIQGIARKSTYQPLLLREAAMALGLLGDREAAGILTDKLTKARSLSAQASIAQALGRIGDEASVDPLLSMLEDRALTDRARSFAAVALGILADKDPLPWNTILSVGTNYTAAPPTLFDAAGFGILNIL